LRRNKLVQATESLSEPALKYFDHWSKLELEASAKYLDDNLSFKGPLDTYNNSKDYVQALARLAPILVEVRWRKTFVDGKDAVIISDLVTKIATVPCAEWFHSDHGKVTSIEIFFDARPFAAMFAHK
jgi:hypothetical protein